MIIRWQSLISANWEITASSSTKATSSLFVKNKQLKIRLLAQSTNINSKASIYYHMYTIRPVYTSEFGVLRHINIPTWMKESITVKKKKPTKIKTQFLQFKIPRHHYHAFAYVNVLFPLKQSWKMKLINLKRRIQAAYRRFLFLCAQTSLVHLYVMISKFDVDIKDNFFV